MIIKFVFLSGKGVDVDTDEFGNDGMGATIDLLVKKHGPIVSIVFFKVVTT